MAIILTVWIEPVKKKIDYIKKNLIFIGIAKKVQET